MLDIFLIFSCLYFGTRGKFALRDETEKSSQKHRHDGGVDLVDPGNSTTPNINPMAVNQEDLPKQVQVVPPPFPQPLNNQESTLQKEMRKSLNLRGDGVKPEENMKAPQIKNNEEKEQEQVNLGMPIGLEKNDAIIKMLCKMPISFRMWPNDENFSNLKINCNNLARTIH